mmetsp:Transcript_51406/g.149488  ORF Transcript_51406/g.149488 Transcript_51406/m.149488 type:complete len:287 (+) Transcript_51406:1198-2058(+)
MVHDVGPVLVDARREPCPERHRHEAAQQAGDDHDPEEGPGLHALFAKDVGRHEGEERHGNLVAYGLDDVRNQQDSEGLVQERREQRRDGVGGGVLELHRGHRLRRRCLVLRRRLLLLRRFLPEVGKLQASLREDDGEEHGDEGDLHAPVVGRRRTLVRDEDQRGNRHTHKRPDHAHYCLPLPDGRLLLVDRRQLRPPSIVRRHEQGIGELVADVEKGVPQRRRQTRGDHARRPAEDKDEGHEEGRCYDEGSPPAEPRLRVVRPNCHDGVREGVDKHGEHGAERDDA